METVFESWFGLARDGKTIGWFPKNPLQFAVLVHEVAGAGSTTPGSRSRCGRRYSCRWRLSHSSGDYSDTRLVIQSTAVRKPEIEGTCHNPEVNSALM